MSGERGYSSVIALVISTAGSVLFFLAQQQTTKIDTPFSIGAITVVVGSVGFLMFRLIRLQQSFQKNYLDTADRRIRVLERENKVCNRRQSDIIGWLRDEGHVIPYDIWMRAERTIPQIDEESDE